MQAASRQYAPTQDVLSQAVDGVTVLLDPQRGGYYKLNAVGTSVWERLDGATTIESIARHIADEYDAPVALIEHDVLGLLEELADAGLVELRS